MINDRLVELEAELLLMDSNMVYDAITSIDIVPEVFYHYFGLEQLRLIKASIYTLQQVVGWRRYMFVMVKS